ncbi:MAG: hypothetical protein Q8R28_07240 [Dehalococcoidia bacterium]|nr:hypothetical protein [Dehalococcoidia bacterium]
MTPQTIGTADWANLSSLVVTLWLFAFFTVTFAINILIGHALIPSLAYSGQLPRLVKPLRPLFYLVAAVALVIDIFIVLRLGAQLGILQNIYPRTLI